MIVKHNINIEESESHQALFFLEEVIKMSAANIYIQGYPGSFHHGVANRYFEQEIKIIPCDSFEQLGRFLAEGSDDDYAVMAIENSIAGTILPNFRILREYNLNVIGEIYSRIEMQLMALPGEDMSTIKEVRSHHMAIKQCYNYLHQYPDLRLVDSEDTALAAKEIKERNLSGVACIASRQAAELYGLDIIATSIEDIELNYTRFFILKNHSVEVKTGNKASIWIRLEDTPGSLLKVLKEFDFANINISKLQSYPVLGQFSEYYFHMDLEFGDIEQYQLAMSKIEPLTIQLHQLGIYKKADISAVFKNQLNEYLL